MRATTAVASLLAVCVSAVSATRLASRQGPSFGCHFSGDGIEADLGVGHDYGNDDPVIGTSGTTYTLKCGTTDTQYIPGINAKCKVNGEKVQPKPYNATFIECDITSS